MFHTAFDMIAAGRTDVGRTRSRNEDSFHLSLESGLALVCDGMGGHAGGDVASRTAVDAIADFITECAPGEPPMSEGAEGCDERTLSESVAVEPAVQNAVAVARSAVQLANRRIHALNVERGFAEGRGMGTTVVGLWWVPGTGKLIAFHAGDSRLYRLRDGELRQMTKDHSLYQMWLDGGRRGTAPHKNIIVRALGTGEHADPDISVHGLMPDDVYLLCSDGLNGMVPDAAIARVLDRDGRQGVEGACARLVDLANQGGGHDNITVVVARFALRA
ncbi:PP2C family protein-serine/threonine phosphatase [Azospirillum soli]|uniref:PP2C family protein-serine/threonine phosphatase n=1 Tax=Azospirillum soli TaxID=1304799 RepID=UPI001AE6BF76|nr:protein phosphatase 2C domain-containing protein [Azospirillum soli]MBP2315747.1 protein phosphatase [Azospirillum soli]